MKKGMKVMMLGSGPERIGKTGELDRFAYEAINYLTKEGHSVVYVDSNPLTLASVPRKGVTVFIEPMTLQSVARIIESQRPTGIICAFGGLLATHLGIFLDREGALDRYGVRVLGTPVASLKRIMEEEIFHKILRDLGIGCVEAQVAHSTDECVQRSHSIGFPLIMRPSFALEGNGGYTVYNVDEVKEFAPLAVNLSPVRQVALERVRSGWVQLALECVHDPLAPGTVHLLGAFEALECGYDIHPGNTAMLAPSPTLQRERLKEALGITGAVAKGVGLCGSFQIRLCYCPGTGEMAVLRLIPCLTRFSSPASLLAGVPLSEINAALCLGLRLGEIMEALNLSSLSRADDKGLSVSRVPVFSDEIQRTALLNPTMCATGARLLVGRSPEETIAKMVDLAVKSTSLLRGRGEKPVNGDICHFPDSLPEIVRRVGSLEGDEDGAVHVELNPAFIPSIRKVASVFQRLEAVSGTPIAHELLMEAKDLGFSDGGIAALAGVEKETVRTACDQAGIHTRVTPLAPFRDASNAARCFFPCARHAQKTTARKGRKGADKESTTLLLLGPGAYRIGQGPETDQALVQTALTLKERGKKLVLINDNPDAVSHEGALFDAVYVAPLTAGVVESALCEWEIEGVILQFCPCLPDGVRQLLQEQGVRVLGTSLDSLGTLTNVSELWRGLREIRIPLMAHAVESEREGILEEARRIGYPILVMLTEQCVNPESTILYDEGMLRHFLDLRQGRIGHGTPLFMQAFQEGVIGAEVLALSDGQETRIVAFLENIEEYGIHNDDCASIIPTWSIGDHQRALAEEALGRIVNHFHILGHVKLHLAIKGRKVYVTGVSPYPGRNVPFAQRVLSRPVHAWIAHVLLGGRIAALKGYKDTRPHRFHVKESVFPFSTFPRLDPVLSPRMSSTGQVMGHDDNFGKAYLKSQIAINPKILRRGKVFLSGRDAEKEAILQVAQKLATLEFPLVSTQGTARFLLERGVEVERVHKVSEWRPNIIDLIKNDEISFVINIPGGFQSKQDEQVIRRATIEHDIPLVTTISGALLMVRGIEEIRKSPLSFTPL
ncbi:MAG: hypothetical protein JRI80_06505 [Deltaproteobacteria bacterium]|nr:hypothetical protein [Deltaproteobacteria bacterium]